MIQLLRDYRGLLSNENLLEAGDYDEASLSPELLNALLEKGYAISLDPKAPQTKVEAPQEPQDKRPEPVSQIEAVEEFVAKATAPKSKTKPKG